MQDTLDLGPEGLWGNFFETCSKEKINGKYLGPEGNSSPD
jgi:hypothetical protein